MTAQTTLPPAVGSAGPSGRSAVTALAAVEARRLRRHPAPWAGVVLSVWWAWSLRDQPWSGAAYSGVVPSLTPALLGVSLAAVSAFGRELVPVAEEAVVARQHRAAARLLACLVPVGLVTALTVAGAVALRLHGGLTLGDEPGRTAHAHHSLPELVQPVLLACLAVAAGAAVVHVLRQRLAASIVLVVCWFLVGTYWLFGHPVARLLTPMQVQPEYVEVGPPEADPTRFPADWLLSAPGAYQDHWARVVVSPHVAAWHDVYLVGLVALLAAVVVPGPARRLLVGAGLALAAVGVALQLAVAP